MTQLKPHYSLELFTEFANSNDACLQILNILRPLGHKEEKINYILISFEKDSDKKFEMIQLMSKAPIPNLELRMLGEMTALCFMIQQDLQKVDFHGIFQADSNDKEAGVPGLKLRSPDGIQMPDLESITEAMIFFIKNREVDWFYDVVIESKLTIRTSSSTDYTQDQILKRLGIVNL
jgi:hypothetical protein